MHSSALAESTGGLIDRSLRVVMASCADGAGLLPKTLAKRLDPATSFPRAVNTTTRVCPHTPTARVPPPLMMRCLQVPLPSDPGRLQRTREPARSPACRGPSMPARWCQPSSYPATQPASQQARSSKPARSTTPHHERASTSGHRRWRLVDASQPPPAGFWLGAVCKPEAPSYAPIGTGTHAKSAGRACGLLRSPGGNSGYCACSPCPQMNSAQSQPRWLASPGYRKKLGTTGNPLFFYK